MNCVKGKLLKKLKTIKTIGYLKPERILQVNAADGFIDTFFTKSSNEGKENLVYKKPDIDLVLVKDPEVIDVSELMKDLEDEDECNSGSNFVENKENFRPGKDVGPDERFVDISSFRPPDLDSGTLFDPNLLAAFEQAVMEVKALEEQRRNRVFQCNEFEHNLQNLDENEDGEVERPLKTMKLEEFDDRFLDFERICPPGGSDSVILYTTSLRSVRKTFEDCSSIRFLLDSFRVLYHERDLSMHLDFREELWRILGGKVVPPKLFIKGRYIGGAEEVLRLHEQGKFRPLLAGIPVNMSEGPCEGCAGVRFMVCFSCSGSRKVDSEEEELVDKCRHCNENGLILCPICC